MKKLTITRSIILFSAIACLGLMVSGCSTAATKAAKHKAKKVSPLHDTKDEKAKKKVDKVVGDKDGDKKKLL